MDRTVETIYGQREPLEEILDEARARRIARQLRLSHGDRFRIPDEKLQAMAEFKRKAREANEQNARAARGQEP